MLETEHKRASVGNAKVERIILCGNVFDVLRHSKNMLLGFDHIWTSQQEEWFSILINTHSKKSNSISHSKF